MTANEITSHMIHNGACPSEIYTDAANGVVYFDTRYVPSKSYADMPVHIEHGSQASICAA